VESSGLKFSREKERKITLPLLSVSLFGRLSGNPFNGAVFVTSTAAVLGLGAVSRGARISLSRCGYLVAGLAVIGFG